ncbi:hypothetical protein Tco_1571518 [Tanacetum coccineum]
MVPGTTPLIGFSGEIIWPIGKIQLLVNIGDEDHSTSVWINFVVVRSPSPHNGIIGRLGVRKLQTVPSTAHEMLKLPVEGGVITLKSSRMVPLECAIVSGPEGNLPVTKQMVEERIKGCSPVRQKRRGQVTDRNQAIQEEVGKLGQRMRTVWGGGYLVAGCGWFVYGDVLLLAGWFGGWVGIVAVVVVDLDILLMGRVEYTRMVLPRACDIEGRIFKTINKLEALSDMKLKYLKPMQTG